MKCFISMFFIQGPPCSLQQYNCFHDSCEAAVCTNLPDVECMSSTCGSCVALFYNTSGFDVTNKCSKLC